MKVSLHREPVNNNTAGVNTAILITVPLVTHHKNQLRVCSLNAQSVRNKAHSLCDYFYSNDFDICAISETWLKEDDHVVASDLAPSEYTVTYPD